MEYLYNDSVRSLAVAAFAALCLWRVKSASIKHAVWALVTAGMLLQLAFGPVLPPLRLPVLHPVELVAIPASAAASTGTALPAHAHFPVLLVIYLAGVLVFTAHLLRAVWFTHGLIRRSEPTSPGRYQSREIAVPVTAAGKILLPLDWPEWDAAKLRDVLAHEEAHVRRRDSLVAVLARINRSLFWFHPLAWWLDRHLARLAEQACDDAALSVIEDRQQYARTLLDMARAVRVSQGRLFTAGMAKGSNVETRINRILDESRRIPKALGLRGWTGLAASITPLIYLAAAVQLAPAQTLTPIPAPAVPEPPVLVAQAAPAPPAPAPTQPQPDAGGSDLMVSIDVSPERRVTFSFPLSESGSYDIIVQIQEQEGRVVFNDHVAFDDIRGAKWHIPAPFWPGTYTLKVLVRNNASGKINTHLSHFEVN